MNLSALVDRPFDELGLDQFFDAATTDDFDADAERRRVASLGAETASTVGGLPFTVGQHAAAATPIARLTLARLKADVKGATESAKSAESESRRGDEDALARAYLKELSPADVRAVAEEAANEAARWTTLDERADAAKARADAAKLAAAGIGGAATAKAKASLTRILDATRASTSRDRAAASEAAAAAASVANGLRRDPCAARQMLRLGLNRRSGAWAEITFDDLVEALLCDGAERTLARVTPGVGEKGAARALHLAAQALLLTSRAAHAARAAKAAEDAIAAVNDAAKTVAAAADVETGETRVRIRRLARREGARRFAQDAAALLLARGRRRRLHRDAHVRSAHVGV